MAKNPRIVVLGDFHAPWYSTKALNFAVDFVTQFRPDMVLQIGDLYDFYAFSRYPRSHNLLTPKQEVNRARVCAEDMWLRIQRRAPRAKLVQIKGNHDDRIQARVSERIPELAGTLALDCHSLFEFPGVETIHNSKEEFFYGGWCFQHGFRRHGEHAKYNQMNTVVGHSHVGGVVAHRVRRGVYFELNAGWLGNERSPAFNYRDQKRINTWTLGLGAIDEQGPRFIPCR